MFRQQVIVYLSTKALILYVEYRLRELENRMLRRTLRLTEEKVTRGGTKVTQRSFMANRPYSSSTVVSTVKLRT
jgi:hypothetical protein